MTGIVLLHPLGVDHRFWDPVRKALPAELSPVIAPDLLGHGKAPLPSPAPTIEEYADAVEAEVAGGPPVHLVGVSLGSLVAQVLAARAPELIDHVVLADGVTVYPEAMRSMWRERAGTVRAEGLAAVVEPMESLWFSPSYRAKSHEQITSVRSLLLAHDPGGYARTCEALAIVDLTEQVGSITAPTLVACGRDDAPPFRAATDWLAENLPDGRAVWLRGGHATAYEHPEEFAEVVAGFLR